MKRAFTLVEMLTVTVIISLLILIGCSVGLQAREKGRQSHCISNLRQLGQAIRMYRDDYETMGAPPEESFPPSKRNLYPQYVSSWGVFICPDCVPPRPGMEVGESYGYQYAAPGDESRNPGPDGKITLAWPALYRKRGEEFPIMYDFNHTSVLSDERGGKFRWDPWHGTKLVLRVSGRVEVINHPVNGSLSL